MSNLNNKALEETESPHMNTLVSSIALWPVTWCGCPSRFSLCRLNMAALLRSARLLKCSPAALLQVFGNSRHVPGRLYSGAVGTTRARLCVQTVPGRVNVNRYNAAWLRHACRSCSCHWKVIAPVTVITRWSRAVCRIFNQIWTNRPKSKSSNGVIWERCGFLVLAHNLQYVWPMNITAVCRIYEFNYYIFSFSFFVMLITFSVRLFFNLHFWKQSSSIKALI